MDHLVGWGGIFGVLRVPLQFLLQLHEVIESLSKLTHNPQWSPGRDVSRPESVQAYQRRPLL